MVCFRQQTVNIRLTGTYSCSLRAHLLLATVTVRFSQAAVTTVLTCSCTDWNKQLLSAWRLPHSNSNRLFQSRQSTVQTNWTAVPCIHANLPMATMVWFSQVKQWKTVDWSKRPFLAFMQTCPWQQWFDSVWSNSEKLWIGANGCSFIEENCPWQQQWFDLVRTYSENCADWIKWLFLECMARKLPHGNNNHLF